MKMKWLVIALSFREFLDEALQVRFVYGLINGSIHGWLLVEWTLTLRTAIDLSEDIRNGRSWNKIDKYWN